jgi:hypothetical protein
LKRKSHNGILSLKIIYLGNIKQCSKLLDCKNQGNREGSSGKKPEVKNARDTVALTGFASASRPNTFEPRQKNSAAGSAAESPGNQAVGVAETRVQFLL